MPEEYPIVTLFYTNSNPSEFKICRPEEEAEFAMRWFLQGVELKVMSRNCKYLGSAEEEKPNSPAPKSIPSNQTVMF